jgi:hypothetical protein
MALETISYIDFSAGRNLFRYIRLGPRLGNKVSYALIEMRLCLANKIRKDGVIRPKDGNEI